MFEGPVTSNNSYFIHTSCGHRDLVRVFSSVPIVIFLNQGAIGIWDGKIYRLAVLSCTSQDL